MASVPSRLPRGASDSDSRTTIRRNAANELVFGVVGHVGSGTSTAASALAEALKDPRLLGGAFDVRILKAKEVIVEWATDNQIPAPTGPRKTLDQTAQLQDLGDRMRNAATLEGSTDHSAVAKTLAKRVRTSRAEMLGKATPESGPVYPDGKRRAYILDSLRHPAEVALLRRIYQEAFVLIGVVCEEKARIRRIESKYDDAGEKRAREFMKRDARSEQNFGQQVGKTFHLADFFVDNTESRNLEDGKSNKNWKISDELNRLVKILTQGEIVRPTVSESAMRHAYDAQKQSACLSRQVGAALIDKTGNLVATGTNEVPRAGGGLYGRSFHDSDLDERCAFRESVYCSNTQKQNEIIDQLIGVMASEGKASTEDRSKLKDALRSTAVGGLLEFSRAVHAEMDALISAGRAGVSTVGSRLFVSTFPCHYCARHLVAAGVDEVQYVEPYPKSQALDLHRDAIQEEAGRWTAPSEGGAKVLFRPFAGVAPRMYERAFVKDREYKDDSTGDLQIGGVEWCGPWHLSKIGYVEIEAEL